MTGKLILVGLKERVKVYAGIVVLYLLYALLSLFSGPSLRMDNFLDWMNWSFEVIGVTITPMTFIILGMAAAALIVAEIIIFARDFYSPQAYLLFSLPVNGKHVVGSRLGLFLLDFLMLVAMDLPFRWPFYRTLLSSVTSVSRGGFRSFWPWLTTSDMLYIGMLTVVTWILIFAIVPLFAYLLIAAAKSLFDLNSGWMAALVVLCAGVFAGLCYFLASVMPPLVDMDLGATKYATNPLIPVLLLIANVLFYWSGTLVIDRKLNI